MAKKTSQKNLYGKVTMLDIYVAIKDDNGNVVIRLNRIVIRRIVT